MPDYSVLDLVNMSSTSVGRYDFCFFARKEHFEVISGRIANYSRNGARILPDSFHSNHLSSISDSDYFASGIEAHAEWQYSLYDLKSMDCLLGGCDSISFLGRDIFCCHRSDAGWFVFNAASLERSKNYKSVYRFSCDSFFANDDSDQCLIVDVNNIEHVIEVDEYIDLSDSFF